MLDPQQLIGTVLDQRFRLLRLLGQGAYGLVFEAEELLGENAVGSVAVKLLQPQSEAEREAILKEVQVGTQLTRGCPDLITTLTSGQVNEQGPLRGVIYLVTELAESHLEDRLLRSEPMTTEECLQVATDLARALQFLHQNGAVHCDVKPANLLKVNGRWKLADFGMTRGAEEDTDPTHPHGTPAYMSPESFQGIRSPALDCWALGALIQECFCGRLPYQANSVEELARIVATEEPYLQSGLPQPLDAVVRGLLVKDPEQRWTVEQVVQALHLQTSTSPVPAPAVVAPAVVAPPLRVVPAPQKRTRRFPDVPNGCPQDGLPALWDSQGQVNDKDFSVLAEVPAGEFLFGHTLERRRLPAFRLSKYPVTNAQFERFLEANPEFRERCKDWQLLARRWGPRAPAVHVPWMIAAEYCLWAGLRLPSEEEWERAARGTDGRPYPWGSVWNDQRVVVKTSGAQPVGLLTGGASPENIFDLIGNCWEWTATSAGPNRHILRGGSWSSAAPAQLRAYFREALADYLPNSRVGFRCAQDRKGA